MLGDDERRQLHVIEQNLLAEAPQLADQFARLATARRSGRGRRTVLWTPAITLLLAVILGNVPLLLGALVLVAVSAVLVPPPAAAPDEFDRRRR